MSERCSFCRLVGAAGHLMTNEHCITSQSDVYNTDYEFMGEASSCGDTSGDRWFGNRGTVYDAGDLVTTTLIKDSAPLDYALIELDASLSASYGHLDLAVRQHVEGEEIYIPQYGAGHDKELAIADTTTDPNGRCKVRQTAYAKCTGNNYNIS